MNKIISICDDDKQLLQKSYGFEILNISDVQNLFKVLQKGSVEILIISKNDPFSIAKRIREDELIDQSLHIIFLTQDRATDTLEKVFKYGNDFVIEPHSEFELASRINIHLDTIHKKRKYEKEIIFNQSVLDSQNNIIFVQNNDSIISVNKSFLDFFAVSSIDEFTTLYTNVANLFMDYENYFSLNILNDKKTWVSQIAQKKNETYDVLLMNFITFEPEAFIIDVNSIPYSDKYVVTLSNITDLTTKSKQFEHKANYDNLTQIFNRNKFNELIDIHYDLFKRYNDDLCFAIFDIDFFKKVNDTYGHHIGDETLIKFSRTINDKIRSTDIFARWGGEEFTLLMPKTTLENAFNVVDHLRNVIEEVQFNTIGHKTCSIGVTQFRQNDTVEDVAKRADEALYEAKETGRNKVVKK